MWTMPRRSATLTAAVRSSAAISSLRCPCATSVSTSTSRGVSGDGVKANGATLGAVGPVVVDGMLYVNSGYNGIVGRAGNVLPAFDVR